MIIFYNSDESTIEEQFDLYSKLPLSHEFGDKSATLKDTTVIRGPSEHEAHCSNELRIKCRKRCTVLFLTAKSTAKKVLSEKLKVLTCFFAVPDWQAQRLDVERYFLKSSGLGPRIGTYVFNFTKFVESVYEDFLMAFYALKKGAVGYKLHLKIAPLGIGPSNRTRYGDYLGPTVIPAYLFALQYACAVGLDASWIETLEFVDHVHGQVTPQVAGSISRSRDIFDFEGCKGLPAILAPTDAFCVVGSVETANTLSATMANNSDLRSLLMEKPVFLPWNQSGQAGQSGHAVRDFVGSVQAGSADRGDALKSST